MHDFIYKVCLLRVSLHLHSIILKQLKELYVQYLLLTVQLLEPLKHIHLKLRISKHHLNCHYDTTEIYPLLLSPPT